MKRLLAVTLAAIGTCTACKAGWTPGLWPACQQFRTNTFSVAGHTMTPAQAMAYDCFKALEERAYALYPNDAMLNACDGAWSYGFEPTPWSDAADFVANYTNYVVRHEVEVLGMLLGVSENIHTVFLTTNQTLTTDTFWSTNLTYSTSDWNEVTAQWTDEAGFSPATTILADYGTNRLGRLRQPLDIWTIATEGIVAGPSNVWWRWSTGPCESDLAGISTNTLAILDISHAAAGTNYPAGRSPAAWYPWDYGWDALRRQIQDMQVSSVRLGGPLGIYPVFAAPASGWSSWHAGDFYESWSEVNGVLSTTWAGASFPSTYVTNAAGQQSVGLDLRSGWEEGAGVTNVYWTDSGGSRGNLALSTNLAGTTTWTPVSSGTLYFVGQYAYGDTSGGAVDGKILWSYGPTTNFLAAIGPTTGSAGPASAPDPEGSGLTPEILKESALEYEKWNLHTAIIDWDFQYE